MGYITVYVILLLRLTSYLVILAVGIEADEDQVFTQCGEKFSAPQGVIHSPNYPNPFPTPIYCEWVIHAPSDKKIILYFTQFYLRGSFDVLEYKHYEHFTTYIDERKIATVNCEDEIPFIVSYKPYLVLRFAVHDMGNIHMRVLDHIVDVFGFNITYEFADRKNDEIKTACSVHYCSYLGNCIASADFSSYQCVCFPEYFGEECQYGPHCDPQRGENMCFNGGKCRYFLGTYVNTCECPRGYAGSRCEIQPSEFLPDYCISLRCDQKCETERNGGRCSCHKGYRLTENNRTCVHIDKYRITVSIYPTPQFVQSISTKNVATEGSSTQDFINDQIKSDLKTDVFMKLEEIGIFSATKFGTLGFRLSSRGQEYRFYFYIEKSDLKYLHDAVLYLTSVDRLGNISCITSRSPKYTTESELYLASVSTSAGDSDIQAAVQGKVLTLSCAARGSENIKFEWFKDGYVIDTSLTKREVYLTLVPSASEELIRSILSIDSVSPYDRGEFSCRVSDYGESESKSVIVDVITLPLVDLDPLSSSVTSGDKVSVRCMSPDDTQKTFLNEWFEGIVKINPGHRKDRIVEDLFPTGTRLFIPSLTHSGTFTCRVTNSAGGVNVTSHIFVPEANETNLECPKEYFKQVMWRKTAGKHFDKQRCPTDTGVFSFYGPFEVGYATRNCICPPGADTCQWAEPNFVRCQSFYLIQIFDELEILRFGYQHTTMKAVYDHLYEFMQKDKKLYSGDIEIATSILAEFLNHLKNFPSLAAKDDAINVTSVVSLIDDLITGAMNATVEEKLMMNTGIYFLKMCETIAMGLLDVLEFPSEKSTSRNYIDMNVKTKYLLEDEDLHRYFSRLSEDRNKRDVAHKGMETEDIQVIEFTFRNLSSLIAAKTIEPQSNIMKSVSNIYSLYPFKNENVTIDDPFYVDIPMPHLIKIDAKDFNQTLCLSWEFDISDASKGRWLKGICRLLEFESFYSVCRCPIPGYFMVGFLPYNNTVPISKAADTSALYLKVGCIFMMCGVVATLIILLFNWRKLKGDEYAIHTNSLLSLLGVNSLFLVCLQNPNNEVICIAGQILTHFLYLAAEAFVLVEALHIYLNATKRSPSKYRIAKYMSIGWGIPTLMTLLILIVSAFIGFDNNCTKMCWVTRDQWQFYGYCVSVTILALSYIAFICLSLKTCLTWKEEWRISRRRKLLYSSLKSSITLVLLIVCSLLGTSLYSENQQGQLIMFVCFKIGFALYIFVSNIICDDRVVPMIWKKSNTGAKRKSSATINGTLPSSSSFRAFIKPDIKPEGDENEDVVREQESVNKYYDDINRIKFTKERKRHLSSLLGSSTSGILMNSFIGSYTFRQNGADFDQNGTDSGIFLGSEQDKSDKYPFEDSAESGIQILLPPSRNRNREGQGRIKKYVSDSDDVFDDFQESILLNNTSDTVNPDKTNGTNGCVIPVLIKSGDTRKHNASDLRNLEESSALIHSASHDSISRR